MGQTRHLLDEDAIPTHWYNVAADLDSLPPPPLHPGTGQPLGPDDLAPLFPMALIGQEVSAERWVPIPDEVRAAYALWRPTPLHRAHRLEEALGTKSRIFYKYEGVSPSGSHKPNTAVAQAYFNAQEGVRRIATETGAGQWGSALSFACTMFGIECKVYMVRASFDSKPYRKTMIATWGGECVASPSTDTAAGRAILESHPDTSGSLGIAISEAVEDAATREDTKYALGSVLNHVLLHQTVIGQEAKAQLAEAGATPDVVIGCAGGGSNFAGISFPFVADAAAGTGPKIIAAEPAACPTLTRGHYGYDFGDTAKMAPLLPMYTLGHDFVPEAIHAGGLRYHGMSPLVSHLVRTGVVEARAYHQNECFAEALRFARAEGIIPAPEPSHALRALREEVEAADAGGVERTFLVHLCGHGNFDMSAYEAYLAGTLVDYELSQDELDRAAADLEGLPEVPA
jgi:tryptophan synthase beta chain